MFTQPIPFGKYYLLERINVGGMAEVFKAKTFGVEGFERLLAVKRILPNIAEDNEFIEMFIDEAKIAVELHHANIAQIYDLGKVDGSFFIALEYIHGKDLRAIFDRARKLGETIPIPMACYIIMKVCEGIDYAHNKRDEQGREMNLVHRDISPQNILVSYEGEVKIIDFGIAKAANKASKTQAGILKGKFGYMSPEQVRGLPLDRRSDIFSVGIVLYELLTGERLFLGESDFSTLEKVRNVEIMPPTLHNPKIPEELEAIVFKALAKNVEERYEHAIDLHDDLQRFLYGAGSFFSRKDLAQHMKRAFSEELIRENAQIEAYRKIQPPSSYEDDPYGGDPSNGGYYSPQSPSLADAVVAAAHVSQPGRRGTPFPGTVLPPGPSRRNTPLPGMVLPPGPSRRNTPLSGGVLPPGPIAQSRRNTPLSGQMYATTPLEDPPLPEPSSAFSSGFVGVVPSEPSTGNTQLLDDSDILIEEEQNDSFFTASQSAQRVPHPAQSDDPDVFDGISQKLPSSGPHPSIGNRPMPPHLPPPAQASLNELLAPDAIPPVVPIAGRGEGLGTGKLVGLIALGVALVAGLALGLYFLLVGDAKGTLVITTTPPDADVFIDNQPLKDFSSPQNVLLEVGLHRVTVIHDNYNSVSKDVVIREGESEMLQIVLPPKDGSPVASSDQGDIYVDSEPAGAEIFVDDVPRPEKTPALLKGLPVGTHAIKVVSPDPTQAPFVSSVEVKAGAPEVIKAKFESLQGSLSITSDPSGAQVTLSIPGEKRSRKYTTPATISDLPLGKEIEVSVEKVGYPKFTKTITLKDTEPFSLAAPLGSPISTNEKPPRENPKNNNTVKTPKEITKNNTPKDPPPVEPPPSGEPGFLTVGSSPTCECIINGTSRGFTPCISIEVKPGKQKVQLKNKDFGINETFTVEVKPGEKKKFNKKFEVSAP